MAKNNVLLEKHQKSMTLIVIGLLAIFAVIEVFRATPQGPAFGSDSVTYMTAATNLAEGRGIGITTPEGGFERLTFYPPFFPVVLSVFAYLGMDLLSAAHWLNAVLFGILVFLMGWGTWRNLRSPLAAVLLAALLAFSAVLIELHAWAMSDALCLVLGMASLVAFLDYSNNQSRKTLLLSAGLAGLAFLTRYAGVAYCITGVLGAILFTPNGIKKRILAGLIYALASLAPMLIWIGIEWIRTDTIASRNLLPPETLVADALMVIKSLKELAYLWFPSIMIISQTIGQLAFRTIYLGLAAIILGVYIFAVFPKFKQKPGNWIRTSGLPVISIFFIFIAVYMIVIIGSYAMVYPPPYLVNRIFAPIQVGLLVVISTMLGVIYRNYKHLLVRLPTVIISLLLVLEFWGAAGTEIDQLGQYPPGYVVYQNSHLIDYVLGLPQDTPLISNKVSVLQYYVGRPSYTIQELYNLKGVNEFSAFGEDPADPAQTVFRDQGGALVLFGSLEDEFAGLYGDQADERYTAFISGLVLAYEGLEGKIFFYNATP